MLGIDFGEKLVAAGLGDLPISWGADGTIGGWERLTAEQATALDAVIAAYDPIAGAKVTAKARIEAKRLELEQAGVLVTWPDGTKSKIQTRDDRDWRNIQGIAAAGLALLTQGQTTETWFRDANDVDHVLTPTQAVDFGFQATAAISAIARAAQRAKDAISAATDEAGIAAAEAAVVWPENG